MGHRLAAILVSWVAVLAVVRVVVALPEHCPSVTAESLRAGATEAVAWLARNQHDDGRWLYRYDREADEDLGGYNTVRHAGVVMSLYQAAAYDIPEALATADAGMAYAAENLIRHDDWAAFEPSSDRVTTGAAALLVAGLVERRMLTQDPRHDELLGELGRFLVAHVEPSGAVIEAWDRTSQEPRHGVYSPFFTGEVYWALALLHQAFPDQGWDEPAARIGRYLATERDEAEDYFPDVPDHWAAYGMAVQVHWPSRAGMPLPDWQVDYVRRQAGLGGLQARWESQRVDTFPRYLLRGRRTLGAGLGTVGEQIAGLWAVARSDAQTADLVEPLAERAQCVAGMLLDRQVSAAEADQLPDPGRAQGAWFQFDITQMDDQQHALSALLLTIPMVTTDTTDQEDRR